MDSCTGYVPAMTFDEIAEQLGITRQAVFQIYKRAMSKIRRRRQAFVPLLALHHELDRNRRDTGEPA